MDLSSQSKSWENKEFLPYPSGSTLKVYIINISNGTGKRVGQFITVQEPGKAGASTLPIRIDTEGMCAF